MPSPHLSICRPIFESHNGQTSTRLRVTLTFHSITFISYCSSHLFLVIFFECLKKNGGAGSSESRCTHLGETELESAGVGRKAKRETRQGHCQREFSIIFSARTSNAILHFVYVVTCTPTDPINIIIHILLRIFTKSSARSCLPVDFNHHL
jgi:hypothetical protein